MTEPAPSTEPNSKALALRLWREHVSHHKMTLVATLVAIAFVAATTSLYPLIINWAFDALAKQSGWVVTTLPWLVLLAGIGTVVALLALWRVQQPALRASFTGLCMAGLLGLGAQPQIERLADLPWQADFWRSHYWSGLLLTALLLMSLAIRPLIPQISRLRRLHVSAMLLACVLFAVVAITGCRDLLSGMAFTPLG